MRLHASARTTRVNEHEYTWEALVQDKATIPAANIRTAVATATLLYSGRNRKCTLRVLRHMRLVVAVAKQYSEYEQ